MDQKKEIDGPNVSSSPPFFTPFLSQKREKVKAKKRCSALKQVS